jgi:hypothetical protein
MIIFYHFWFIKLLFNSTNFLYLKPTHSLLKVYLSRINSNAFVLLKPKKAIFIELKDQFWNEKIKNNPNDKKIK